VAVAEATEALAQTLDQDQVVMVVMVLHLLISLAQELPIMLEEEEAHAYPLVLHEEQEHTVEATVAMEPQVVMVQQTLAVEAEALAAATKQAVLVVQALSKLDIKYEVN
jgi:hypothetical protein